MSGIAVRTAIRSTLRSMEERAISDVYDRPPAPLTRVKTPRSHSYRIAVLAMGTIAASVLSGYISFLSL